MDSRLRSFLQVIGLILFAVILFRLFPIIVRVIDAAAINIVHFWWAILFLVLALWLIWVLKHRN